MPETFEQHFLGRFFKRDKPKSPESPEQKEQKSPKQIKEEKGLELAKEIKEIKERMAKEGKTIEGYQRIIELAKEIKKLFEEKEKSPEQYEAEVKTIVANLENALKERADSDYVALSLAGVGTKEAMALRKRLLKEGASKDSVSFWREIGCINPSSSFIFS